MSAPVQTTDCAFVVCRYLGLDSHLILRTSRELADSDPGLTGNLLLARMVDPLLQFCNSAAASLLHMLHIRSCAYDVTCSVLWGCSLQSLSFSQQSACMPADFKPCHASSIWLTRAVVQRVHVAYCLCANALHPIPKCSLVQPKLFPPFSSNVAVCAVLCI